MDGVRLEFDGEKIECGDGNLVRRRFGATCGSVFQVVASWRMWWTSNDGESGPGVRKAWDHRDTCHPGDENQYFCITHASPTKRDQRTQGNLNVASLKFSHFL